MDSLILSNQKRKAFDESWAKGAVPGWQDGRAPAGQSADSSGEQEVAGGSKRTVDMSRMHSAEALGLERLKEGLEAIGLKCGGNLKDRSDSQSVSQSDSQTDRQTSRSLCRSPSVSQSLQSHFSRRILLN